MDGNSKELLKRLTQLPPEERKRILNAFLESAIVVNRKAELRRKTKEEDNECYKGKGLFS